MGKSSKGSQGTYRYEKIGQGVMPILWTKHCLLFSNTFVNYIVVLRKEGFRIILQTDSYHLSGKA